MKNETKSQMEKKSKTEKKSVHDGHRERLRRKYLKKGIEALEDHEILELILFYSIPRKNTNELAHELINTFINLEGVFKADKDALMSVENCGETSAILIRLFRDMHNRMLKPPKSEDIYFNGYEKTAEYIGKYFLDLQHEVLYAFYLNKANKLVGCEKIAEGGIDSVEIRTTKIISACDRRKTYSVVVAHNHPGGNACPSEADVSVTAYIGTALSACGLRFKDHFIIAPSGYMSFLEDGFFITESDDELAVKKKKSDRKFLFG